MKVFVAGATGALGTQLVPRLVANGHEVVGHDAGRRPSGTRSATWARGRSWPTRSMRTRSRRAVAEAEPEVIVHQLTALSGAPRPAAHRPHFAATNRLRTEGTDHLLAAGRAVGRAPVRGAELRRLAVRPRRRAGQGRARPARPRAARRRCARTLDAIRHLEEAVTGIDWGEGLVLRYGGFYGPGHRAQRDAGRGHGEPRSAPRRVPVVGDGGGVWSLVHIEDAAAATVAAVEGGAAGIYQVVDDEPAPVREWLPALAAALRARPPRRLPRWLGRLAAGEAATVMMTEVRGASNAKAKRELGWRPRYPSWRQGFADGLG